MCISFMLCSYLKVQCDNGQLHFLLSHFANRKEKLNLIPKILSTNGTSTVLT